MIRRDPWRKPYFLMIFTWIFLLWLLVPLAIVALISFNKGFSVTAWQGFSTEWYFGPRGSVFRSPELRLAFLQTLKLAVITATVSVPIGTAFAMGMDRWRGRTPVGRVTHASADVLMVLAFVTPELILAVALFFCFAQVLKFIPLGTVEQATGLIMMTVPYSAIIVRARLLSIGRHYEETAMDLGASPSQAVHRVLLPMLYPAIMVSTALVLARVMDDLVVVRQLASNSRTATLTMKIYGGFRVSPTPVYNAMAVVMVTMTFFIGGVGYALYRRLERVRR